jgi:hypothetical protein
VGTSGQGGPVPATHCKEFLTNVIVITGFVTLFMQTIINYMLKGLYSKYARFPATSCFQTLRTITIDLHSLQSLIMSGAIPVPPPVRIHAVDSNSIFSLSLLSSEFTLASYFSRIHLSLCPHLTSSFALLTPKY